MQYVKPDCSVSQFKAEGLNFLETFEKLVEEDERRSQKNYELINKNFNKTAFISGLEGIQTNETDLISLLEQKEKLSSEDLHALAIGFCVELVAHRIFKNLIDEAHSIHSKLKKYPPESFICTDFSWDSTEGAAFFFRFLGNYDSCEYINAFSGTKIKSLKKARKSTDVKFRKFAQNLYDDIKKERLHKQLADVMIEPQKFLMHVNDAIYGTFKKNIVNFTFFVKALNTFNSLVAQTAGEPLMYPLEQTLLQREKEISECLSNLESRISDKNVALSFQNLLGALKNRRARSKNKLDFTKKYLTNNYSFIPFQIEEYLRERENYLFPKVSEKEPESKDSFEIAPKSKAKPKPAPVKKKRSRRASQKPRTEAPVQEIKVKPKPKAKIEKELPVLHISPPIVKSILVFKRYHPRVLEWFKPNPYHLETESYASLSPFKKFQQKVFHGFPREIEKYANEYGFLTTYANPHTGNVDRLVCVLAQITFKKARIVERGSINYCVGNSGDLYHRHFSIRLTHDMQACARNAFHKFDYSLLDASAKSAYIEAEDSPVEIVEAKNQVTITKDKLTEALTIDDLSLDVSYVLFKVGS